MPTYSYQCSKCEHVQDVFHAMSAEPRVKCEACGGRCKRLIGSGAGIIFKGSGFYETDFKKKSGTAPAKSDGAKTESAPAAKSEGTKTAEGTKKESSTGKKAV